MDVEKYAASVAGEMRKILGEVVFFNGAFCVWVEAEQEWMRLQTSKLEQMLRAADDPHAVLAALELLLACDELPPRRVI